MIHFYVRRQILSNVKCWQRNRLILSLSVISIRPFDSPIVAVMLCGAKTWPVNGELTLMINSCNKCLLDSWCLWRGFGKIHISTVLVLVYMNKFVYTAISSVLSLVMHLLHSECALYRLFDPTYSCLLSTLELTPVKSFIRLTRTTILNYSKTTRKHTLFIDVLASHQKPSSGLTSGAGRQ